MSLLRGHFFSFLLWFLTDVVLTALSPVQGLSQATLTFSNLGRLLGFMPAVLWLQAF